MEANRHPPIASFIKAKEAATPSSAPVEDTGLHHIIDVYTYNRLSHLLTVTAYVLRFVRNTRKPSIRYTGPISPAERTQASLKWIQSVQRQSFTPEILNLTSKSSRLPLVRQLCLFLDKGGLIHCGGRIHNSPVSDLPNTHSPTSLCMQLIRSIYMLE